MTTGTTSGDREAVFELLDRFVEGMHRPASGELAAMLDDDFTLTHMTGYVQPRDEWLKEIGEGLFIYHSIRLVDARVELETDAATATARTNTDASVHRSRATWRLRLAVHCQRIDGAWRIGRVVADTW